MLDEERHTRDMIALWESGVDGIIDAFKRYCAPDVKWINTGIPSVEGLEACIELLTAQAQAWKFSSTRVDARSLLATPGLVMVERIDRVFDADGEEIFAAPVVGVLEWADGKITQWRDYFDPGPLLAVGQLD
ncbi:limonene-1,2-epoxide hydrolase family protein [Mycobacterium sp. M23085]|uniref:limonene-1,2-epoxide hydrolase family protein n=1 Tax=Mycobacterium sp. M23085 TaxID=3378087 RepID=UPI003877F9F8